MNALLIISYAVFIVITHLIPLPILDELVKSFFYQSLVRALAAAYKVPLSAGELSLLAEDRGQGCLNGCLIGLVEFGNEPLDAEVLIGRADQAMYVAKRDGRATVRTG